MREGYLASFNLELFIQLRSQVLNSRSDILSDFLQIDCEHFSRDDSEHYQLWIGEELAWNLRFRFLFSRNRTTATTPTPITAQAAKK